MHIHVEHTQYHHVALKRNGKWPEGNKTVEMVRFQLYTTPNTRCRPRHKGCEPRSKAMGLKQDLCSFNQRTRAGMSKSMRSAHTINFIKIALHTQA